MLSARHRFKADMRDLQKQVQDNKLPEFLESVPFWKPHLWTNRYLSISLDMNNCYNLATNRRDSTWLVPGCIHAPRKIGAPPSPEADDTRMDNRAYRDFICKGVRLDKLRALGSSFTGCSAGEHPVALFIKPKKSLEDKENDFHWFAPRVVHHDTHIEEVIWVHKAGIRRDAQEVPRSADGLYDIFAEASRRGYTDFVGFYAVPDSIQKERHALWYLGL